jgi:uncharacterized RDD family membrane protein YckC
VKCPKCHYLGFETGDRCKNCGYDFSLLSVAESEPADYEIHPAAIDDVPVHVVEHIAPDDDPWLGAEEEPEEPRIELAISFSEGEATPEAIPDLPLTPPTFGDAVGAALSTFAETPVDITVAPKPIAPFLSAMSVQSPAVSSERALPLFKRGQEHDDEPLIKMPAAPRPPLAVRRTPDTPRLRAVPRPISRPGLPPALQFPDEGVDRATAQQEQRSAPVRPVASLPTPVPARTSVVESIRPVARVAAALIDGVLLLGIDAAVVYFTVRMAGLPMDQWTTLPVAPLATFLTLLTVSYLCAFTAVGGQTIGKMALGTCVVDDDGRPVDAARALRRTSAVIVSFLFFGLGFIPALFGDHRALHDRYAGTRVVRLRSV